MHKDADRQQSARSSQSGKVGNSGTTQLFTGTYRGHCCCLQGKEASMPRTVALKESAPPRSLYERHPPEKTLLYRIIARLAALAGTTADS